MTVGLRIANTLKYWCAGPVQSANHGYHICNNAKSSLGYYVYLMIFCFSSENSKVEVRAGRSSPLSIIIKIIFNEL